MIGSSVRSATLSVNNAGGLTPAEQRADACAQFAVGERLRQVIVRAQFESLDPILDDAAGGQNQDGRLAPERPKLATDGKPVHPREHQIENDQIVRRLSRPFQCLLAVPGHVDDEGFLDQTLLNETRELRLVLDQ